MAFVVKDRVRETTTTTGTGTITLAGAASGYQSFAVIGNANETFYTIADSSTGAWETGYGVYTSAGTTLTRAAVYESSNSNNLVNFGAGAKDVFCSYPASKAVALGITSNDLTLPAAVTANSVVVGTQANKATISYTTNTARTLTIPNVAGNRSFSFIDQAETFSAVKTFSANPVLSANSATLSFSSATGAKTISTGGTTNLILSPGGHVGIGTTSPTVYGSYRTLEVGDSTNAGLYSAKSSVGNALMYCNAGAAHFGSAAAYETAFITHSVERMRITSTGNVGIGNTNADSFNTNGLPLVVGSGAGHTGMTIYSGTSHFGSLHFADGTSGADSYRGSIRYNHNANVLELLANGTVRATVKTGFAATTVGSRPDLFIAGSDWGGGIGFSDNDIYYGGIYLQDSGTKMCFFTGMNDSTSAASGTGMKMTSSALFIGLDSTLGNNARVEIQSVSGNANIMQMRYQNAGSGIYTRHVIDSNGDYYVTDQDFTGVRLGQGATSWAANSDERNKTAFEPLVSAADKLLTLRTGTGRYKEDINLNKRRLFLIAQDVLKVYPEAVSFSPDAMRSLSLSYTDMIVPTIAAVNEHTDLITALTQRIEQLEARLQ
jgi:hypothetical protein